MQTALDARKVELRRLQAAHRAADAAARAAKETFRRAKEEAEVEHPLDDEARARFAQMSDDRYDCKQDYVGMLRLGCDHVQHKRAA
jgi:hypothetical protein